MTIKTSANICFFSGFISLIICWFFWYPVLGIVISIVSLMLSIIAIVTGRKLKRRSRNSIDLFESASVNMAKLGVTMGYIGFFISFICLILSFLFTLYFRFT